MSAPLTSRLSVWFASASGSASLCRTDHDVAAALRGDAGRRRPSDLVFSADGRRVVCVTGEAVELSTSGDERPLVQASNAAGHLALHGPRGFAGIGGGDRPDDVRSVAFEGGRRFSLHTDGTVRGGDERIAHIEHARRLRASGDGVLAVVSEHEGSSTVRRSPVGSPGRRAASSRQRGNRWALVRRPRDGRARAPPVGDPLLAGLAHRVGPDDRSLLWADYAGFLYAIPIGEVPADAITGLAVDPDAELLHRLSREIARHHTDDELRSVLVQLDARSCRTDLWSSVAMLRGQITSTLRDRAEKARTEMLFAAKPPAAFGIGDRVRHAKFGEGPVTAVEGSGADAKITVAFGGRRAHAAGVVPHPRMSPAMLPGRAAASMWMRGVRRGPRHGQERHA